MYSACENNSRPANMSIRQFIATGMSFCHTLEMHHNIEEQHVFPYLATRMPAFKKELELLTQHKQIHAGMEKMEDYLSKCQIGETELRLGELKGFMDTFGKVLWEHLEQEVKELGAENMRKYWSMDDMRRMPM
jgi:hemerythrin-like domain-containing protein